MPKIYEGLNVVLDSDDQKNLLEIKLKDTDAVPEVYYKGKRIFDDRLISINYEWETIDGDSNGKQKIDIKGYDIDKPQLDHPSVDGISHTRLGS